MDEPTSAITDKEVDQLFEIIAQLKGEGKSIVYITHKMNEVFTIADEIIRVPRRPAMSAPTARDNLDQNKLITLMVGRELTHMFPKGEAEIGEEVALGRGTWRSTGVFKDVSFALRQGEILGLAGLVGAGPDQRRRDHLRRDAGDRGRDPDRRQAGRRSTRPRPRWSTAWRC